MDFNYVRGETVSNGSQAARVGDLDRLRSLLVEEDTGWMAVDNRGWGPLHHAASCGQSEAVKLLGEAEEVDINSRTWEGETPLFLACKALPVTKDVIHALLKLNVDVNLATNERCSPLQYAAVKGEVEIVKWLVRKGARINETNVWGETALHTALKRGANGSEDDKRLAIVRYLLKHEAKVICTDENNLTPLMLASQKGSSTICEILLTHSGFSYSTTVSHANMRAEDGATALMLASQGGYLNCVETLLGFGADPDLGSEDGTLAVHLACTARVNSRTILERLLPQTSLTVMKDATNLREPEYIPKCPDKKVLNPYQLTIEWENLDSLSTLVLHLDPVVFPSRLEFCFLHKDLCPDPSGFCSYLSYRLWSPLALLLSERPKEVTSIHLELFQGNIQQDLLYVSPIVALLTSSVLDINSDMFSPDKSPGVALSWLANHGAVINISTDIIPLLIYSSVSGLFRLVRMGLLNPLELVDPANLSKVKNSINFGMNGVVQTPLVAQRLLCTAVIATKCGILVSDWVQDLALLVLDQLYSVFSIDRLVVVDNMYKDLRQPKDLQALARREVLRNIGNPSPTTALDQLHLPPQIKEFLLFDDIDVNEMIMDYKKTLEHITNNGMANVAFV